MELLNNIRSKYYSVRRNTLNRQNAARLKNQDFSVFASNCNGAVMLHDLGRRFDSPFVNLWVRPEEFLRFLREPKRYLACELSFIREDGIGYPIGLLDDVRLYFQHYGSEEEAARKWRERSGRIHWDNLFILFTDRDGCTDEHLRAFDSLPYKNKIVFTRQEHPDIASAVYIRGFEDAASVGVLSEFRPGASGRRYFDDFDYVSWFNGGLD